MKKYLAKIFFIASATALALIGGCSRDPQKPMTEKEVAIAWADLTLYITKNTPANSPTFASRCLGYIGLTMYESVAPGFSEYNSIFNSLNGLGMGPAAEKGLQYNWVLSLNAGQAEILRSLYIQTSEANKHRIDSLENLIRNQFSVNESKETLERSVTFGQAVAKSIFEWSLNDGGHRGYLANFDKQLQTPTKPGCWEPPLYGQSFSHFPLHPHWGKNRTFVKANSEIPAPALLPFDSVSGSAYSKLFADVYDKSKTLTQTEKEIALWWGDDPSDTFTPPGHSYYLATLVLRKSDVSLVQCAETYARVGMAVADAFIDCWKWKYSYFSERPSSFISKHIDNRWESFWPDPPFPAFPSGHATQAAAAVTVLADLFGDNIELVDDAHVGRPDDEIRGVAFKARKFSSFSQVAQEIADSRFYGGIHTKEDNDVGLREGKKIGMNINALNWKNTPVIANK